MICALLYRLFLISVSFRRSPLQTEGNSGGNVTWFNNRRLLEPIGNPPPAKAEAAYYASLQEQAIAA